MINNYMNRLAMLGADTDAMEKSLVNLFYNLEYQARISDEKGKRVSILPKNKNDISVGDIVKFDLGLGYPNEIWYPHWCYILKETPMQYIVIPCTSNHEYQDTSCRMVIDTVINRELTKSVLNLSQIRSVDKQRVDYREEVGKVLTPKSEIKNRIFEFLKEEM